MDNIAKKLHTLHQATDTDPVYRPVFFRTGEPGQGKELEKLLSLPGLFVNDRLRGQLRELVKLMHPARRFTDTELESAIDAHLGATAESAYGVWVYYPWSNRLVHLLDRDEFVAVRTSRNQYKITPTERDRLAAKRVGVIGLSVGQSVSVTLAMERVCGEIRLADFDVLELTNLNRIRTGVHNLGLPKVYSVAREIAEIDPFIHVVCFPQGLREDNLDDFFLKDGKLDLVVEESDGFDIKILARYKARELGVPVVMEASDRCMVDVERFDLEPERPILHGIVRNLDIATLKSLRTNEEKIPYMLDVLGFENTTPRLRASMLEMQQTITTWPQLASAVTMGGGITADVTRRILLGHFRSSGRYYVDIEELIGDGKSREPFVPAEFRRLPPDKFRGMQPPVVDDGVSLPPEEVRQIVQAACLAPSSGNLQPWMWVQHRNALLLCDAMQQTELIGDPGRYGMMLSLGASLENARQKAAELGYTAAISFMGDGPVVAAITFKTGQSPLPDSKAISRRHTNRGQGKGTPLPDSYLGRLREAAADDAIRTGFLTAREDVNGIARAAAICERLRLTSEGLHQEHFSLLSRMAGGNSIAALMSWPPQVELAMQVARDPNVSALLGDWDLGGVFGNYHETLLKSAGAFCVISGAGTAPQTLVKAGMIAERIWLRATTLGLAVHPLSLPLALMRSECRIPGEKKSYLHRVSEQLSLIFSGVDALNVFFLLRISEAAPSRARVPRKVLDDVFIKLG